MDASAIMLTYESFTKMSDYITALFNRKLNKFDLFILYVK